MYIFGPKLVQLNFFQISQLFIQSRAHKLFELFTIFERNFA